MVLDRIFILSFGRIAGGFNPTKLVVDIVDRVLAFMFCVPTDDRDDEDNDDDDDNTDDDDDDNNDDDDDDENM